MSETDLVNACLFLLRTLDIEAWRQQAGGILVKGSQGRHWVRLGPAGVSDITGILPDGRRLEVECKRPGNRLTKDQMEFQQMIQRNNGVAITVYNAKQLGVLLTQLSGGEKCESA